MNASLAILKKYWKHSSFREPQDKIIQAVLNKKDVIALLPTGGGKSICFQIPALQLDGVCIVVSPLIALMQDQVSNLNERGIKALSLPSGASQDELITLFDNIQFGNFKFLYVSPERLQSQFIQDKIKQLDVSFVAIDEAHCISEWGHDFRPAYRNIKMLKTLIPTVSFIALTATATKKVLHDIEANLELANVHLFKKSFLREQLAYQVFFIEDKLHRLLQIATKTKAPIIVYVNTRNKTKDIATFLNANGFASTYYHGGLATSEKQEAFDSWMLEKNPIIVATNAFGMGIDKENVKVVVHLDMPNSVENYLQEAGRAGRNGEKSFSNVLINQNDIAQFKERFEQGSLSISEIKNIFKSLNNHFQIANGEVSVQPYQFDLRLFCSKYKFSELKTQNTLSILQANGILEVSKNIGEKSTIQFLISSKRVLQLTESNTRIGKFTNILLRSYGGVFEQQTKINEYWLSKKLHLSVKTVVALLEQLHTLNYIEYKRASNNASLLFFEPREDDATINRISKNIKKYINQKKQKALDVIYFMENNSVCRSIQLLTYFNETKISTCGICDVCLNNKPSYKNISTEIIDLLSTKGALTSKEICSHNFAEEATVLVNLQQLLSEDVININNYNQYTIT